jgi:small-conductance mechanosensitive channel
MLTILQFFIVAIVTILVLLSLISTSAAGVLTSAGSAVLALSWLFSATAQEFLRRFQLSLSSDADNPISIGWPPAIQIPRDFFSWIL